MNDNEIKIDKKEIEKYLEKYLFRYTFRKKRPSWKAVTHEVINDILTKRVADRQYKEKIKSKGDLVHSEGEYSIYFKNDKFTLYFREEELIRTWYIFNGIETNEDAIAIFNKYFNNTYEIEDNQINAYLINRFESPPSFHKIFIWEGVNEESLEKLRDCKHKVIWVSSVRDMSGEFKVKIIDSEKNEFKIDTYCDDEEFGECHCKFCHMFLNPEKLYKLSWKTFDFNAIDFESERMEDIDPYC